MKRPLLWMLALLLPVIGLFGCRSVTPSVNYYILRPMDGGGAFSGSTDSQGLRTVAVRPIQLPQTVNRIQMVRRSGHNQLTISEFHRWADYPDRMMQQVLEENLQVLIHNARVVNQPWPVGLAPDITVSFQFRELVGTTDKQVLLRAVWSVIDNGDPTTEQSRRVSLSEPISGSGFNDLAAAHSRVLMNLCREVALTLNDVQ